MVLFYELAQRARGHLLGATVDDVDEVFDGDAAGRRVARRLIGRSGAWGATSPPGGADSAAGSPEASANAIDEAELPLGGGSDVIHPARAILSPQIAAGTIGASAPSARSTSAFFSTPAPEVVRSSAVEGPSESESLVSIQGLGMAMAIPAQPVGRRARLLEATPQPCDSPLMGTRVGACLTDSPSPGRSLAHSFGEDVEPDSTDGDDGEEDEFVSDLLARFFWPPPSALGARLRRRPRVPRGARGEGEDARKARELRFRTQIVADALPESAIRRLADACTAHRTCSSSDPGGSAGIPLRWSR